MDNMRNTNNLQMKPQEHIKNKLTIKDIRHMLQSIEQSVNNIRKGTKSIEKQAYSIKLSSMNITKNLTQIEQQLNND